MGVTSLSHGIVGMVKLNGTVCRKYLLSCRSNCLKNINFLPLFHYSPLTKFTQQSLHFIIVNGSYICLIRLKALEYSPLVILLYIYQGPRTK